jgi:hypothetical protein
MLMPITAPLFFFFLKRKAEIPELPPASETDQLHRSMNLNRSWPHDIFRGKIPSEILRSQNVDIDVGDYSDGYGVAVDLRRLGT